MILHLPNSNFDPTITISFRLTTHLICYENTITNPYNNIVLFIRSTMCRCKYFSKIPIPLKCQTCYIRNLIVSINIEIVTIYELFRYFISYVRFHSIVKKDSINIEKCQTYYIRYLIHSINIAKYYHIGIAQLFHLRY